ncbi:hypothetical protein GPALN_004099 [Globodera pallida]|nr:hypothetical protein GPALN_004099 [Globodera pallida]
MEASSETGIDNLSSTKRSILRELETTIELVASTSVDFVDNQLSGDLTQALCTVVEAIFIHGLRDAFFLKGSRHSNKPSPNFWPFVSKYTHRSIKTQISTLNQIHNEIGRARAWIRIVLNEYALDHYISLFSKDTKQMNQFYAVDAFLRDSECISSLDALLKRLNGIRIAAPTNSSLLNAWTPSPLMLAGLIKGTPTVRAAHTSRCAVAGIPLDVPSSSLSPNGLLPMGKGFRTGSSSPSAASSSAVLLQDDALAAVDAVSMTIASGEEQIVAEFGMEADQLLLVAEQTEGPISAEEQHQQQGASSSSAAAMADDLESVYSHPSMMEDHSSSSMLNSVLVGTSEHHQRRRQNAQNYYNSNNKWIMASMPTEELSAEVVVHRKAKQRHRRRTMSRSSCGGGSDSSCGGGGGGADGSSSRCQSSANLHTFAESVESKEENASTVTDAGDEERQHRAAVGAADNVQQQQQEAPVFEEEMPAFIALNDALSTEGTAMGFDIEQLQNQPHFFVNSSLPSSPPFGTSLQDELLAAAAAAVAEKEEDGGERFAGEELARKKFSATDEQQQHQQMARDLLINSKIVSSSAKVSFSYSTDSMDDELLHNTSGSVPALPATFDEALRNFLGREAQKRRRSSRARTSSSTTNVRLFSECSSSSAGGAAQHEQLQSPSYPTNLSSPQQLTSSPTTALAQSAAATNGHSATKRGSAATVTAFLFLAKELAPEPFKREEREAKNQLDAEEELITVPLPPSVAQQQLQRRPPWTTMSARTTKTYNTSSLVVEGQQQQVDDVDEPYRLPRRLYRLTQIPRELGLDSQEFRCAACRRNIGASFGPFNVCALNGRYYCAGHCIRASGAADNEATLIPARMLLNGDVRPRTVSKESRMLLRSVVDKPFMRLDLLNPHIYAHCTLLRKIKELRLKFSLFVLYLFSCRDSIAEDAKRRIWPQKHWHEDIHLYSIAVRV